MCGFIFKQVLNTMIKCFIFCFTVPPEVHLLNKKISQRIGKETILSCIISAAPQGLGLWLKDGKSVESDWNVRNEIYDEDSPHTITLNLRIMSVEEKDFGHYTCEASNILGGDSESMFLYGELASEIFHVLKTFVSRYMLINELKLFN